MAERKNTFLLKRSNVPGKVPSPGDLKLGEVALNTADAILYASGTTANSILPIGWDRISRTGDTVTGDFNIFGDVKISGSSLPGGYALSVTGDTNFSGDVYVGGDLYYNGSLFVTGNTVIESGLTANTIYTDYIDFNTGATATGQVGRLIWNNADEIGGLEITMRGGNVTYQLGEENLAIVYNADSVTLTRGMVVYVYGSQGNTISVKRASATGETTSAKVLGVVSESISVGGRGFVNTFGLVRDLDTSAYSGGSALWLSTTAGTYTNVKPNAPNHNVLIGFVSRVSSTVGSIFIHISNGWELDELHDVRISGVTTGDLLTRSTYNGSPVWVNSKTLNGSYNVTGGLTVTGNSTYNNYLIANTLSAATWLNLPPAQFTGGTVVGNTIFLNGLSANTISATTYLNLPVTQFTGGTVNGPTIFTNGLSANTISATTYLNLPSGVFKAGSGGTYSIIANNDTTITATGNYAYAEGSFTTSTGDSSHAEGYLTTAGGNYSHAEGEETTAIGNDSHAEGYRSIAEGNGSHAEGFLTTALGLYSHAEGWQSAASGDMSHVEGRENLAKGDYTHVEGRQNTAYGYISHAEGFGTSAVGWYSHSQNWITKSIGMFSHAEGAKTTSLGDGSHAEGSGTTAFQIGSHSEGVETSATTIASHAEGLMSKAIGEYGSHAEGYLTSAVGDSSHAEGDSTTAIGGSSHAEGVSTTAKGVNSHAEGYSTKAIGEYGSHSEGQSTIASGASSHAEGINTISIGQYSHAEGSNTVSIGTGSHSEGQYTMASGISSHSEGYYTTAIGNYGSHAEGNSTTAYGYASHAEGQGNTSFGLASHAEGGLASGLVSSPTKALGASSHSEGLSTTAIGDASHAQGQSTIASGTSSHAEGYLTTAKNNYTHAGGVSSIASGLGSFIHSSGSTVTGKRSVVLGGKSITGSSADTVYVPNLNINVVPSNDNSLTQVLVRATDGTVKYKLSSSFPDVYTTGGTYSNGVITFKNNDNTTFTVNIPSNYSAGPISGATGWSSTGTGQMNLPALKVALFNNSTNYEPVSVYNVAAGTTGSGGITGLTNNDTNYIVVDYNSGSPIYKVYDNDGVVNDSSVVLVYIVYRLNNFIHVLEFGNYGAGLPNKLNDRLMMTDRFGWESGLSLGLSGSTGVVTLSSGVAWNASYRQSLVSVNSQDDIFFRNYHSGGTWAYTTTGNTLNNTYYDNGTNPVVATSGKYLVNWYFRGQEVNDHLYEVYGIDEYDSVADAELATEPTLPELITSHAFLTGRIIVKVGENTGYTQSAFVRVFQSAQVTNHNDLLGLQGGTSGEYYHLSSTQYNNLAFKNVNNNFSTNQSITGNLNITGVISGKTSSGINWVSGATSTDLVRITQNGSGNAFVVEDSTNPDSSSFIITNAGSVGIGKTPSYKLDVADVDPQFRISASTNNRAFRIYPGSGTIEADNTSFYLNRVSNTNVLLGFGGGNVGVGTISSPTAKLHVNNTGTSNSFLVEDSTNPDSTPFVIDNAGNVGIGLTSPSTPLHIKAAAQAGVNENIIRLEVSDAANAYLALNNAATTDSLFVAEIVGRQSSTNTQSAIYQGGYIDATQDTGTNPVTVFRSALASLTSVSTRPLFDFRNWSTSVMIMAANGNVGINDSTPESRLTVVTSTGDAGSYPATSGTTQSGNITRLRNGGSNLILDIGGYSSNGSWIQPTNLNDLSLTYPLLLNPNGGNVAIGKKVPTEKLDVSGKTKTIKLQVTSGATAGYVLTSDASGNATWQASTGGVSSASNVGSANGIFYQKSGSDLQFRSLSAGTNVTITSGTTKLTINATGEANTASNLGSGNNIFAQKSGVDLQFRSIVAGSNITITSGSTSITIASTGGAGGYDFGLGFAQSINNYFT